MLDTFNSFMYVYPSITLISTQLTGTGLFATDTLDSVIEVDPFEKRKPHEMHL